MGIEKTVWVVTNLLSWSTFSHALRFLFKMWCAIIDFMSNCLFKNTKIIKNIKEIFMDGPEEFVSLVEETETLA